MSPIQDKFLPLAMSLAVGCATPQVASVASVSPPAPSAVVAVNDSVSPDACFGMRTGAVVLTLERTGGRISVKGVDLSKAELSSVGRCLSAYVVAHPPEASRVLFRHRTGSSPEFVAPAPSGSAAFLADAP